MISSLSRFLKSQLQSREPRTDVHYERLREQQWRDIPQPQASPADQVLAEKLTLSMRRDDRAGPAWRAYFAAFSDERSLVAALGKELYERREAAGAKRLGALIRVILETQDLPSIQAVHDWAPEGFYDGNKIYCTKQMIFMKKRGGSSEHALYFKNLDRMDKDHVPAQAWNEAAKRMTDIKGTRVIFEPVHDPILRVAACFEGK